MHLDIANIIILVCNVTVSNCVMKLFPLEKEAWVKDAENHMNDP